MKARTLEDAPADINAWKQKVHAVDMALRTVQTDATSEDQKRFAVRFALRKPKLPINRVPSPSRP